MEPHSSKRTKVENKPSCSSEQSVGSNLMEDLTSLDSSGSSYHGEGLDPDLNFQALRWTPNFVDKTLLCRTIIKDRETRKLLTAPPRFGKTMAQNMLQMFFEIVDSKERSKKYKIFKDLKIAKCSEECTDNHDCETKRFFHTHFGQYPVISLDFGELFVDTYGPLLESFRNMLSSQFEKYEYLIHKDAENYTWSNKNIDLDIKVFLKYLTPADEDNYWMTTNDGEKSIYIYDGFRYLIEVLSAHYQKKPKGKKIIILIDEFDAPFMEMLTTHRTNVDFREIIIFIQKLTRILCKDEVSVKCVCLVAFFSVTLYGGITLLGANNVLPMTFLDNRHDHCKFFGFTKEEVEALVKKTVTDGQQQKALDEITVWYNNYTILNDKDTTICNSWSVKKYLDNLIRKNYWIDAVGSKYIYELFKFENVQVKLFAAVKDNHNICIFTGGSIGDISNLKELNESLLNCNNSVEVDLALQFLAECGYFNIIKIQGSDWTLKIPNEELRGTFRYALYRVFLYQKTNQFDVRQKESFVNALESLGCGKNNDPMKYVTFKKSVENLYTDRKLPETHFHFHCDLWMLIFRSGKFHCGPELPIRKGYSPKLDLIVLTESAAIIIEVKRRFEDSAEDALEQCLQKEYYFEAFEDDGNERKVLNKILIGLYLSYDGKVDMRYLENFDWKTKTLPDKENIKTIVEASHKC